MAPVTLFKCKPQRGLHASVGVPITAHALAQYSHLDLQGTAGDGVGDGVGAGVGARVGEAVGAKVGTASRINPVPLLTHCAPGWQLGNPSTISSGLKHVTPISPWQTGPSSWCS